MVKGKSFSRFLEWHKLSQRYAVQTIHSNRVISSKCTTCVQDYVNLLIMIQFQKKHDVCVM